MLDAVIERVLRVCTLEEADEADVEDLARMTLDEGISRVDGFPAVALFVPTGVDRDDVLESIVAQVEALPWSPCAACREYDSGLSSKPPAEP